MGKGRQDSIVKYCEDRGLEVTPADPKIIAEYERSMREECIPAIERALREQAKARAKFLHQPQPLF